MGKTFRLLFNLYPGEGRKASLFIFLGLLWGVGSYGTFTLSEGMFLEHVGAQALPQTYFAIAATMFLLSSILIFALNRVSIRYLLLSLIIFWVLSHLTLYLLLPFASSTYWFLFKVIGWVIPISTYIVYWAFVDQYYDLQDGKRFFCLFNATLFLGDALGGAIISFLLEFFGVGGLILLFGVIMGSSLPFIFLITRRVDAVLEEHHESIDTTNSDTFKSIFRTILKSKFTLYLILFYFSMQLLAIVTEFSYMDSFERAFSTSSDYALTEFIGTCGMLISLVNMFFAMFLYSRLVKKVGINNIILIAPTFFLAIFLVWFWKDALPIAIFGMIAREGMVYTFDDNNLNLLISGVPTKTKNQVRISIESFIEPAGMLVSATLLLFFQHSSHILGLILAAIAIGVVIFLRAEYPRAIFRNLLSSTIRFEKKAADWVSKFSKKEKRETEFLLLTNLKKTSEKEQLLAFEYLLKMGQERVLPPLLNHVGKLTLPGKLKAIDLLSESRFAKETIVMERIERWRKVLPHPAIKSVIHFYFAKHGCLRPERVMNDLDRSHLGLRSAAILTLKTTPYSSQFPSVCSLASEKLRLLLESKQEQELCAGLNILGLERNAENLERIIPHLQNPSLTINRAAARALAFAAAPSHKHYARQVITHLCHARDPQARLSCLKALEKFADTDSVRELILSSVHFRPNERKVIERIVLALGEEMSPMLLSITKEGRVHDRCRLLAGKILGKLDLPSLQRNLFSIIHLEIERAYFYFYHAETIQKQIPEHDLSILENTLYTGYQSIIDFIIQLLGVAGSIEDSEILSHTLRSKNRKIRGQAVESLEKTCDARLFALIEPLIDERKSDQKLHHYLKAGHIPLKLNQLLDKMSHSPSLADQIISISLKAQLKTSDWKETLQEKLEGDEEIFHHFAHELL